MAAEDVPGPRPQDLRDGPALRGAQDGVRVHAGHQVGSELVVGRLLRRQLLDVDEDVPGEDQSPPSLHQHQLPGQVAPRPLVELEVQVPEGPASHPLKGLRHLLRLAADDLDRVQVRAPVGGQSFADAAVGGVEGIPLPEAPLLRPLHDQGPAAAPAHVHRGEQVQQPAVVHVGVGDHRRPGHAVEILDQLLQDGQHLLAVAGVAGVHRQQQPPVEEQAGVAAAGGLDAKQAEVPAELVPCDPGMEVLPPVPGQGVGEAPDALEGLVEGLAALV